MDNPKSFYYYAHFANQEIEAESGQSYKLNPKAQSSENSSWALISRPAHGGRPLSEPEKFLVTDPSGWRMVDGEFADYIQQSLPETQTLRFLVVPFTIFLHPVSSSFYSFI